MKTICLLALTAFAGVAQADQIYDFSLIGTGQAGALSVTGTVNLADGATGALHASDFLGYDLTAVGSDGQSYAMSGTSVGCSATDCALQVQNGQLSLFVTGDRQSFSIGYMQAIFGDYPFGVQGWGQAGTIKFLPSGGSNYSFGVSGALSAPEIDSSSAAAVLTLMAAIGALGVGRRRRPRLMGAAPGSA